MFGWFKKKTPEEVWNNKSDASVLSAFIDATEWIDVVLWLDTHPLILTKGKYSEAANSYFKRLELYILPQMKKRGLL